MVGRIKGEEREEVREEGEERERGGRGNRGGRYQWASKFTTSSAVKRTVKKRSRRWKTDDMVDLSCSVPDFAHKHIRAGQH